MDILIIFMLSAALLIASITDLRSQRIYNWLTFPLILAGFGMHIIFGGFDGLKLAAGGFALGFILMVIPYFMGAMGAGDVKLMAGIGAWLGAAATATAFLFTCMIGGVYCLIVLLKDRRRFKAVWTNIKNTFIGFYYTKKFDFTPANAETALPRLCYGVVIAVGTVIAILLHIQQTGSITGGY